MGIKSRKYYYGTMNNHRIRVVELDKINFRKDDMIMLRLDPEKKQDYQSVTVP